MIFVFIYLTIFLFGIINVNYDKKIRLFSCVSLCLILSFVMGFRMVDYAGEDTIVYVRDFERIVSQNYSIPEIFENFDKDYFFYIFARIFSYVVPDANIWMFVCALFYIYAVSKLIYRYSPSICLSYIIFVSWQFYLYDFQLMRHCFSLAFVMLAFPYVINRKFKPFIIAMSGAITSQIVSVVSLISYWLTGFTISTFVILGSFAGLAVAFLMLIPKEQLLSLIFSFSFLQSDRFSQFEDRGGEESLSNAIISVAFILVTIFLIFRNKKYIRTKQKKEILTFCLIMSTIGTIFYSLQFLVTEFYRVAQYFSYVNIIMVPIVLKLEKVKFIRYSIAFLITLFCMKHFWGGFLNAPEYYPYKFFWD